MLVEKDLSFLTSNDFGKGRSTMNVLPLPIDEQNVSPKASFAGLDTVRAFAALGVVLLHSCAPYLMNPMPGLAWSMRDEPSPVIDFTFWSIEVFIMPVFLLMAGFLAWKTLTRRGPSSLVKSRAKRLLIPLLFAMVVVLPLDLYCWVLGWVTEGLVAPIKLKSLKFDGVIDQDLWGLGHLWFLHYLFFYVASLAIAWKLLSRWNLQDRIRLSLRGATWLLLGLGTCVLYFRPEVVWGFQHAFLPVPSKWFYSGLFFAFGAVLANWDGQLTWLKSQSTRLVGPAIVLAVVTVLLGQWQVSGGDSELANVTLAGLTCGSALLSTLAIVGIAVARIEKNPVPIQYLAAASFWVYLVHHPILGLVHIDLKWLLPTVSPIVKTGLSFTIATTVSLLLYEAFVRRSFLGRWLGFRWEFPTPDDQDAAGQEEPAVLSIGRGEPTQLRRAA